MQPKSKTALVRNHALRHGLTDKQADLIDAFLQLGRVGPAAAAANMDRSYAYKLLRTNPRVKAALVECTQQMFGYGGVIAFNTLIELAQEAESEAVRRQAARDILDRAMGDDDRTQIHKHEFGDDEKEILGRIEQIVQEIGAAGGKLIEGTAEEVEPEDAD